jgi:hypothetical protein
VLAPGKGVRKSMRSLVLVTGIRPGGPDVERGRLNGLSWWMSVSVSCAVEVVGGLDLFYWCLASFVGLVCMMNRLCSKLLGL